MLQRIMKFRSSWEWLELKCVSKDTRHRAEKPAQRTQRQAMFPEKGVNQRERAKIDWKQKKLGTAPSLPTPTFDCHDGVLYGRVVVTLGVYLWSFASWAIFLRDKGFESEISDSLRGMAGFFFLFKLHFGKKRRRNILAASQFCGRKKCLLKSC